MVDQQVAVSGDEQLAEQVGKEQEAEGAEGGEEQDWHELQDQPMDLVALLDQAGIPQDTQKVRQLHLGCCTMLLVSLPVACLPAC